MGPVFQFTQQSSFRPTILKFTNETKKGFRWQEFSAVIYLPSEFNWNFQTKCGAWYLHKRLFNTIMMDSERDISWDKLVTTEPTTRHLPVKNLLGARKLSKNDAHHQIY